MDAKSTIHWLTALARFEQEQETSRGAAERAVRKRQDYEELLQELESDLAAAAEESAGTARRVRELERRIQDLEAQADHKRQQQGAIRDNKEFQVLSGELAGLAGRIDSAETELLGLIEQLDVQKREIDQIEKELAARRQKMVDRTEELARTVAAAETRWAEVAAEIATCTAQLDLETRAVLERLRTGLVLPVVWLDGGACGGCHAQFPRQTAMEIDKGRQAVRCQACGRFVVGRP